MKKIAIVFVSRYGQTEKIAERIRQVLERNGALAQVFHIQGRKDFADLRVRDFDAILIGAPVYAMHFPRVLLDWTLENVVNLNALPCGLFTVSMNAADARPEARKTDQRMIDLFLRRTGLKPRQTASLIGALAYRKYNFLMRWIMKRISASAGGPTDTSKNHELTDWAKVAAFAETFSKDVGLAGVPLVTPQML